MKTLLTLIFVACVLLITCTSANGQAMPTPISITTLNTENTETFDDGRITATPDGATSSVVPPGFGFIETGSNGNTTYVVNSGSASAGGSYSFGATNSTERAFGSIGSGTVTQITYGFVFTNNTGFTINSLIVRYNGELYRNADSTTDRLDFSYNPNTNSLTDTGYIDADNLDYPSPNVVGTTPISGTITGLNIPDGQTFAVRFIDVDSTGFDDSLAIDDFTLIASDNPSPTAIELVAFDAYTSSVGNLLGWRTGFEVNNLGFNIYREHNGHRTRLNKSIIAGSALMVGAGTKLVAGKSYAWRDTLTAKEQQGAAQYWLEEIDLDGTRTWHGPVRATDAAPHEKASQSFSPLLSEITNRPAAEAANDEHEFNLASFARVPVVSPQSSARQREIAASRAVKIGVRKAGWYRVTQSELVAAGFDASADPRRLQLFADGMEVPMRVLGEETGSFGAGKFIEFYGVGFDTPTTDTRTYWLITGDTAGKRIQVARARKDTRSFRGRVRARAASSSSADNFAATTERKERLIYFYALLNGDKDNFFGQLVTTTAHTQILTTRDFATSAVPTVSRLEVALQAGSAEAHQVGVFLNDTRIGTLNSGKLEYKTVTFDVPADVVKEGANNVTLVSEAGETDVSLVDYLRLTYPRRFRADTDKLAFNLGASQTARVEGFTNSRVRVIDVTRPDAVSEIPATIQEQAGNYAATITLPSATSARTLFAFTENNFERPAAVTANQPADLHDTTLTADLVVITNNALRPTVAPLVALRQSQGLRVVVVDIEDVFDEWSFGNRQGAPVVREFLRYAKENWQQAPSYVLLVGDASFDSRNYVGGGSDDIVPTKLIDSAYAETASDEWLVDFDEDGVGELAIGRLPAGDAVEAERMIAKITNHIAGDASRGAVLFADSRQRDGFDFVAASQAAAAILPDSFSRDEINRNPDEAATHTAFIAAVNRGPLVVNYLGHGSVDLWSGAGFFSNDDARALSNGSRLPFFTLMTCLNGYYIDSNLDSLAETLLKAENGGAVAVWASSGMTVPQSQAVANQALYRGLFADNPLPLGEAVRGAKAATADSDVRRTWVLFGDPSMRLR